MSVADNISILPSTQNKLGVRSVDVPWPRPARWRRRHSAALLGFIVLVLLPVGVSAWYLWRHATDQYASTLAFSVRSEEVTTDLEMLGGFSDISGSRANDSDVLYDYLGSQHLVEKIDDQLDLVSLWSAPKNDPVFAFDAKGKIEDLRRYWTRMVQISHDSSRGIIEVQTRAFAPEAAQKINAHILALSTELINQINNIANEDAVRYALEDLQRSKAHLGEARRAITEFRIANEIVDPSYDAQMQANLIALLETQLTETLIEIELLSSNTRQSDTRLGQANVRAQVLRGRLADEREKRISHHNTSGANGIASLFSDYERLQMDVVFAEERYQSARAGFDAALSDARRNTRYLAAHILPTRAQKSLFPNREMILGLIAFAGFLAWAMIALIGLSFLERK